MNHGFFEYEVSTAEKAMAHGEAIMKNQVFRNYTGNGEVEFLHVYKVKVKGEGLDTAYPAEFKRT